MSDKQRENIDFHEKGVTSNSCKIDQKDDLDGNCAICDEKAGVCAVCFDKALRNTRAKTIEAVLKVLEIKAKEIMSVSTDAVNSSELMLFTTEKLDELRKEIEKA